MEVDKHILKEKVLNQNLRRFRILPLISIPINLGHIIYFYLNLPQPGNPDYIWHIGIILSHLSLAIVAVLMFTLAQLKKRTSIPGSLTTWILFHLLIFILIATGIAITIVDQIVTPAITPLLITYVAVSVVFLIHPRNSAILLVISFLIYFFLLPFTQTDPEILLSNRLNGLTAIGLAYLISLILWKANQSGLEQTIIIEEQQRKLELNNRELKEQTTKLNEINATKDKLFSIIAHDLRNPFNSIIGFSELLKTEINDLKQNEIVEYAALINNSAYQTLQLLDNLLDWSRMQQGKIIFSPAQLNLALETERVFQLIGDSAAKKNIRLLNEIPAEISMYADNDMLRAILRNLLSNAVKFTRPGGTVKVLAKQTNEDTRVIVRDNGIGISDENIGKLFNAATNFTIRGTQNETGTGLGLLLCKDFIEKHGGSIWVKSEVDKGSEFLFSIPRKNITHS